LLASGIDVLVNSAGILCNGDTLSLALEDFDRCMNINTRSAFILTKNVLPHLIEAKGNIVNVSSVTGDCFSVADNFWGKNVPNLPVEF
jgi:NAD(P)-dependent dehydrogenase (short-subunit alcohol dehydrogenase family)